MKRDYCATNPIQKLDRKKLPPREVEIYGTSGNGVEKEWGLERKEG
jgi:hypothetical protein